MTPQQRILKRQAKQYAKCAVQVKTKDPKYWPQAIVLTLLMDAKSKESKQGR